MRNTATNAAATTRRASTRIAISVLIALAALLSLLKTVPAQTTVDYDLDNDGYIDVSTHAQLNAIRWDLDGNGDPVSGNATAYGNAFPNRITTSTGRMGCPATGGCTGYELLNNIDMDTDGDGSADSGDAYWNSGNGWEPIGTYHSTNTAVRFNGDFKGNGYVVENLFISRSSTDHVGLFGVTHSTSRIESLGVTDANVTGQQYTGILVGTNYGEVVACYTTGAVTGSSSVGGLVGDHFGTITTTYSTASVSGTRTLGGLIGYRSTGGTTANSYSTGAVGSGSGTGGFQGDYVSAHGVTASYYDNQTSGKTSSNGGSGQSTSNLQTPTGYTGIYSTWNANIDGVTGNDDPWDFGASSQYPVLKYGGHSRVAQGRPAIDYDTDGDNYIEVSTHAQLNAIRYDLNGDGNPSGGPAEWRVAFPSAAADAGCAATCTGYELTGNIDIDTNGDGLHSSADAYWDSGNGWAIHRRRRQQQILRRFQGQRLRSPKPVHQPHRRWQRLPRAVRRPQLHSAHRIRRRNRRQYHRTELCRRSNRRQPRRRNRRLLVHRQRYIIRRDRRRPGRMDDRHYYLKLLHRIRYRN